MSGLLHSACRRSRLSSFALTSITGLHWPESCLVMASPMGTKPSRLRCMAYSLMFPRQKGGAFSAAEEKRTRGKELQDGALGDERR